ncbi:MAG: hypothetical protein EXR91_01500 [Gemmatimonadetes bacterium]|nr:hypothetical protein [Gemmatimonadota bacterium]
MGSVSTPPYTSGARTARIERFVRYCARPPFALERLHAFDGTASLASPESRLLYRFPKPDVNGRTEILLTPLELLERIARFVPPPGVRGSSRSSPTPAAAPLARARAAPDRTPRRAVVRVRPLRG